jgi:transposase-like protein
MKLNQLLAKFDTEEACKVYLTERRWPNGVVCPKCGNPKPFALKSRPFHWVCKKCSRNGYRFSVTTKTVFENTKYPLRDWFKVIFLLSQAKKGMSALQIQRTLGMGSYETAWYMCHRIRAAMKNTTWGLLMGEVEVDETYVGGKLQNMPAKKRKDISRLDNKTAVIGAISRKGNVVAKVIDNADQRTLTRFVREAVSEKVSLVATDEHMGYRHLETVTGRPHDTVKHYSGEYVRGTVHTQTIDGFWSLLKRGIVGNYHQVSRTYLPLYLAEFTFRYNNRGNKQMFDAILAGC